MSASARQNTDQEPRQRTILAVDDDPGLLRLIELKLRGQGYRTVGVTDGRSAADWLSHNRADLVLVDFKLPDMLASELIERLAAHRVDVPFIVITGFGDELVAVDMMKRGARDYLRKDGALLELLPTAVDRTLQQVDRENRLAASEEAFRLLHSAVDQAKDAVLITTADLERPGPTVVFANPAFYALTGYTEGEVHGLSPRFLQGAATDRRATKAMRRALAQGDSWSGQLTNYRKDGTQYLIELSITPVRDDSGAVTHFVAIERDITERSRLEDQVRQSAKMEAVGSLAGGIAHDFNNMLAVIRGHTELLAEAITETDPRFESLDAIRSAGEHATSLTRQLLSFSRKGVMQPERVDLNVIVERSVRLLRRLIGENIEVKVALEPSLVRVAADPNQMEQVVLNLAINARDAMPNGGVLSFALRNVTLEETGTGQMVGIPQGTYVLLTVSDTGVGMDHETLSHLFEPFFTTKRAGHGTGLGLATVYGIIRQSGGHIRVYSEPGSGTRFEVYLPKAIDRFEMVPPDRAPKSQLAGTERLLVAEDDPMVRRLLVRCLLDAGYTVIEAADGRQALDLVNQDDVAFDGLVSDVMMPNLSGPELAAAMKTRFPGLRVLFISGYTDRAFEKHPLDKVGSLFLPKPFTPHDLLLKVRALFSPP